MKPSNILLALVVFAAPPGVAANFTPFTQNFCADCYSGTKPKAAFNMETRMAAQSQWHRPLCANAQRV